MIVTIGQEQFEVNLEQRTAFHPATAITVGFYESSEPVVGRFAPNMARPGSERGITLAHVALATQAINEAALRAG